MMKDYLPGTESGLMEWSTAYFLYLEMHYTEWNVAKTAVDDLTLAYTAFATAYRTYHHPDTHTPSNRLIKDGAKKAYLRVLRVFNRACLIHNPLVDNGARRSLGLRVPSPDPTPSPDPKTYPVVIRFVALGAGWTKMYFRDVLSEKSNAKPFGVHCAEIKWGVFQPGAQYPASADDLPHSASATRSPFIFKLAGADRRKELFAVLRWENTRGVKGPWGPDIESTVIE
ncbi:MAG: hypothetical protein LBK07_07105 [Tannerella sp.]|jgi:hypothetical protein|nr:hypothetical protein [Tannerella sp.]